ncbi:MAG: CO dehydrogenase/CO-methylating acetyl-CoA synthase complex subunit beta [Candidatus Omnitrophica bacterium]|nr:CO dehydrogenase/CO-methylating acetyl-CoA synthase complex subunit beta [Candidatus Omnitrophota bacterium]MBU4302992.1 CO dehydrogenase/CO-methylating acetyl-CoA synthase complex subunit beta [Candidatus Omnitrophota bacterium]MBU4419069.1 CO dehydrogenase/CO-methylating acetyl-CoA synthase complex subunit beta [Candidatus Omnitrophota bacterium]MBU4467428.1 CO dehydrogenase/CO-methylating acetyl-CoA synthase complex subunit beta [Candidatus Omnitrophota bacterium]
MPDLSLRQVKAGQVPPLLAELGTKGTLAVLNLTRQSLDRAISQKGQNVKIEFPETNYYLPLINALLNIQVKNLQDCLAAFNQAEALANQQAASSGLFINSLGGLLNQGMATLICEEILAAIAVLNQEHPAEGWGFIPDKILRSLGLQLVDGRIAGIAVILGPAKDDQSAVELIRDFQSKSIVSFLAGNIKGNTFKQQLQNQGVELGLENYIVALGDDYLSAIYAINFAVRVPLIYGGNKPGQWEGIADYIRNRVLAFVLLLGQVDELSVATGLGALAFGLPVITDLDVPQLGKIDTTLFEALVTEKDYRKLPSKCILTRGIKVKMLQVPVPLPYAAAFEGERVLKEQLAAEFGGKAGAAIEFLSSGDEVSITDGSVELIGPDIDQLPPGTKSLPLAIVVDVFGRKMQKDFESILERQIHRFINYGMGLMHMGQRDRVWIRISQDAYSKGFRLKHLGIILHAMLHAEYSAIVDKVQVKLYTQQEDVARVSLQAQQIYNQRDERLAGMTDESVDTFYSCLLCQSFAPNHVCVVTPERLGLCGAYSWLDAKASFEIIPTGPNQPILKGNLLDARLGQWDNINAFVQQKSNQTISAVSMYSLMDSPQSSCGCFECIVAILPEANGVMLVHRDYSGNTPCGMSFTTLAGLVGGGVQTPGFLGVGKLYILSKKFISAEGGLTRVVWMPKELKEILHDKLKSRAQEIGQEDLLDKIADESVATSLEELLVFLKQVAHPVLTMDSII